MVGWGIFLTIMGAGSLLLPSLGFQFRLMELVDDLQPYAGIAVAAIGAALLFLGMTRGPRTAGSVSQRTLSAAGAAENTSDDASRP
jgi:hypothetical protein